MVIHNKFHQYWSIKTKSLPKWGTTLKGEGGGGMRKISKFYILVIFCTYQGSFTPNFTKLSQLEQKVPKMGESPERGEGNEENIKILSFGYIS